MSTRLQHALAAILGFVFVFAVVGTPAFAQKSKAKRETGQFISFDATANTIKVKQRGQEEEYTVKPEGSILTRTSVKINGHGAKVSDLKPEMRMIVYWIPDEKDPHKRFARTIDCPNVPKDLEDEFDRTN